MPQEPSSRPQPQYWKKSGPMWMQDFTQYWAGVWHPYRENTTLPNTRTGSKSISQRKVGSGRSLQTPTVKAVTGTAAIKGIFDNYKTAVRPLHGPYRSIQNDYRQTFFPRAIHFELQIHNRAARRINFHYRSVGMLAEIPHCRHRFCLEFQFISITDTDFVLKMNICVIISATTVGLAPNSGGH